jgi:hypothetical protein
MADSDLDEFLTLVGGEADADGFRFWRCPRRTLIQGEEHACPYVLTDDPSRAMGEPCSLCARTDRSRCVGGACGYVHGGAACQVSLCGYPRRD